MRIQTTRHISFRPTAQLGGCAVRQDEENGREAMSRRPLRIATTKQLERSVREAGFEVFTLPELNTLDFNRPLMQRLAGGAVYRPFLERNDIELVLDFNTEALTLSPSPTSPEHVAPTTAILGIPYVACYLDPVTSTMGQVAWAEHWQLLEQSSWIKWIW